MMTVTEIIEQVKMLPPSDAEKVRAAADEIVRKQNLTPEEKLEHLLFEAGLLREIKRPPREFVHDPNFKPIEILDGKPISETIIE